MTSTNGTNGDAGKMPVKTREVSNAHQDSTVWNDVKLRPDDIIISTYAKSGTTWTQQIVSQLLHQGDPTVAAGALSPWVELRIVPRPVMLGMLEAQTHRRFLKTHLPLDAMVWDPKVKYIFIARDGRDMIWSLHHHFRSATPAFYAFFENEVHDGPTMQRPSENPRDLFVQLVEDDTRISISWPFWSHIRSWWEARHQPNLLLVHFNDLKADLEGNMRRIAKFLEIPDMPEDKFQAAVEHSSFAWMKEHAEMSAPPQAEVAWENGAQDFINKGTNSRWKDVLSQEDNKRYLDKAREELGEECANWLQNGGTNYY
ncbi:P-loop containing nucleoside triphosphate hydrolase protein [Emericellopsis atlantica]|uniref:P-loop containing nucleoside triphosphate hydrolase protein n=1 Tax=Emericellopsis atlantica TaxID=2614577 RepID=A0A9P7ZJ13_9HYPO|nr:P-loop containing nucleoside triphosphate hydrolase protein [Emericellopsis atlantica]KAG9252408.1 P-loop containing nucleoside triphosphate hydrolase protein [Emericellopsis atlantica]